MHTQPEKRHSATACVFLAGSIIALTGRATARSPLTNSEAIGVTRDMVQVLTAEWPPLDTSVSLSTDRRSIHEPLETELRRAIESTSIQNRGAVNTDQFKATQHVEAPERHFSEAMTTETEFTAPKRWPHRGHY